MKTILMLCLAMMLPLFGVGQGSTCYSYNDGGPGGVWLGSGYSMLDGTGHWSSNQHGLNLTYYGTCTYSGYSNRQVVCSTTCFQSARQFASPYESNMNLRNPLLWHQVGWDGNTGSSFNPEGGASCAATAAVAVTSCSIMFISCPSSVSISGSGAGAGVSISFPAKPIYKNNNSDMVYCPSKNAPTLGTPIIIDTDGKGYHLSSSMDGVLFNFFGTGPIRTAWPLPGSTNGFLVLPDANGMVPTAKQMFGNQTGYANGFLQLAQYDTNNDGVIDNQDSVYQQLSVWIDTNRDGVSQPGELHPLAQIGIQSISLKYRTTGQHVDDNGNAFRYRGTLTPFPGDHVDRIIYDVILSFGGFK